MSGLRVNLVWLVIFALTLPLSVVFSTNLARHSFEKVRLRDQTIHVKGYAERRITSDYALWTTQVQATGVDLKLAYATLSAGRERVLAYLKQNGFADEKVNIGPVDITTLHPRDAKGNELNAVEGYRVSQGFWVDSPDVKLIDRTARQSGDLIRDGIELQASRPQFLYTKLDGLKLQMLSEASENARARAEVLIGKSSGRLGSLRSAAQGIFQITPPLSTTVADEGLNDTSSIDKVIKAVVNLEFAIE